MARTRDVFIWTKIGDDAGEFIDGILRRKDAERREGNFWWGIGSGLDRDKLRRALSASVGEIPVVFSAQRSPPRPFDSDGMRLWTRWVDDSGMVDDIPDHVMVFSRGKSERYYSLVCRSDETLQLYRQRFDQRLCRNFPDGKPPGDSQNTSLLIGDLQADHGSGLYTRGFRATLIEPWFVKLDGHRLLTPDEQDQIANWDGENYTALVRRIRG